MGAEADLAVLAAHAMRRWHGGEAAPTLLKFRENAVFRVTMADGRTAAMRIHRPGYQSTAALHGELAFMRHLGESGIAVPHPIPADDGALLVMEDDMAGTARIVDCLSWIQGQGLGTVGVPLTLSRKEARQAMHALGGLLARLHTLATGWTMPAGTERPFWDFDSFLGPVPRWGRVDASPFLALEEQALVLQARGKARVELARHPRTSANFSLIHADPVRENVLLQADGHVALIDFDDCGHGWHAYDLAVALYQNRAEPDYPALEAALLEGYASHRHLMPEDLAALPLFGALRALALIGWMASRTETGVEPALARRVSAVAVGVAADYVARG